MPTGHWNFKDIPMYIEPQSIPYPKMDSSKSKESESVFEDIPKTLSELPKPNRLLRSVSFLIPSKFRENFIGDLWELTEDMKEAGCSTLWIKAVSLWHISLCVASSLKMSLKDRIGGTAKSETEAGK